MRKISHFFAISSIGLFLLADLLTVRFVFANNIEPSAQSIGQNYSSPAKSLSNLRLYIPDIVEDEFGFLWFASFEGLIRFDGYDVKTYYSDKRSATSLPANFVRRLYIDSSGVLWVGTIDGLAKFNRENESFERISIANSGKSDIDIWSISESDDGTLLVATSESLYQYNPTINGLEQYNKNIRFPTSILSLHDEPSRLWIGTFGNGAFIYDKRSKQLFSLAELNPWSIKVDASELHDVKVIEGQYWLATNKGLLKLGQGNADSIDTALIENKRIRSIVVGKDEVIATTKSEIITLKKQINEQHHTISSVSQLKNEGLLSFLIDKNGSHWLGTDNGVLTKKSDANDIPLIAAKPNADVSEGRIFESIDIWGLAEDVTGAIWSISQNGEIQKFLPEQNQMYRYTLEEDIELWDLSIDNQGKIWVATNKGLRCYAYENQTLLLQYTLADGYGLYNIHHKDGKIRFFNAENELVSVDTLTRALTSEVIRPEGSLVSPYIVDIDSKNRAWISSGKKTLLYDLDSQSLVALPKFIALANPLVAILERSDILWIVTHSEGIYKTQLNELNQLANFTLDRRGSSIFAGQLSTKGIWLASAQSLSFFNFDSESVSKTVKPSQLSFNSLYENVSIKTNSGLIGFGGKYGYHLINPSLLEQTKEVAVQTDKPFVSEFRLNAEQMPFTDIRSPLEKPIYITEDLHLNYDDDRFSFGFVSVNSVSPMEVEYRYKLDGYDADWTPTEDTLARRAIFHNIPWGSYQLMVQAREPNKLWSDSRILKVTISPPPWFSKPALLLYVLFIVLVLTYFVKHFQQRRQSQKTIQESEERLKLTLWSSGDELWDWDVLRGQIFRSNTWGILDFPQDDIRTNSAYQGNIHSADIARVKENLQAHLEGKSEYYEVSYRAKTFKNKWIWLLDRGKVVQRDHNKQAIRMTGTLKNIQHLKEAEEQLKLFERSIENISEGVFITDTAFKFISVNSAYCKFTGETKEQALASFMYFHQYPAAFTEEVRKSLTQRHNWSGEIESRRVDGAKYEMELNIDAVLDEDGKISHFVGVFSDITSRKSTEKELLKLANTDPLTDLPNRSFFQASQQNLVRKHEAHTLLCLDMDNFKKINDSLGHQTGDVLIKQISKRLQRITGKTATCYRLGGDEFSILIEENADVHTVTHYAQNVLDNLSRPFIINKQEFVLSASIGIAFYPSDGTTPQEMLKNADTAMYFAKNSGGNAYKFFSGEMNQNAVRQLQIENLIRQGLKDDLFSVFYQPKVDIASGRLVSMEALVRFEHPQKGIVSPSQFIPLAEQSGQIIEIGEVVLEKALQDTKRWVDAGLFSGRVAVNISAKQFELHDLDERIYRILNKVGISSVHLECEITEGTLMENPEQGLRLMQKLRDRGIHLALDDFGTGYSSLAYLKRFPLNTLKIDKAFIDDIATSNEDRHMAAAIINIAHNLGLNVVAEGVEHEEQLSILRRYDCEMLQGYLYSKPLRAERFEALLSENLDLHQFLHKSPLSD